MTDIKTARSSTTGELVFCAADIHRALGYSGSPYYGRVKDRQKVAFEGSTRRVWAFRLAGVRQYLETKRSPYATGVLAWCEDAAEEAELEKYGFKLVDAVSGEIRRSFDEAVDIVSRSPIVGNDPDDVVDAIMKTAADRFGAKRETLNGHHTTDEPIKRAAQKTAFDEWDGVQSALDHATAKLAELADRRVELVDELKKLDAEMKRTAAHRKSLIEEPPGLVDHMRVAFSDLCKDEVRRLQLCTVDGPARVTWWHDFNSRLKKTIGRPRAEWSAADFRLAATYLTVTRNFDASRFEAAFNEFYTARD